jgi:hypothetical protein
VTLTIERLVTRGKIPRKLNFDVSLIEQIACEHFAAECTRQLRRPWPVQVKVARIRQLRVRVKISAKQLTSDALASAWSAAFIQELSAALAHPNGVEIVHFASRAEYLASAIRDSLTGRTSQRWVYEEFDRSTNLGIKEAVFLLFEREVSEIVPTLLILQNWGLLDRLLAVWDPTTLERLFVAIESSDGNQAEALSFEDLITVASILLGDRLLLDRINSSRSNRLGERKLALKLFLRRTAESKRSLSPEKIFRALCIFDPLLDLHQSLAAAQRHFHNAWEQPFHELLEQLGAISNAETRQQFLQALRQASETVSSADLNALADLLDELGSFLTSDTHRNQITQLWNDIASGSSDRRAVFAQLLGELTSIVRSETYEWQITQFWEVLVTANSERRAAFGDLFGELASTNFFGNQRSRGQRWISTDWAGLFLLIDSVQRLGWADRLSQLPVGTANGPRLMTYILAGMGLSIMGRFDETSPYLDPGLALFSGWFDGPDLGGLRRFLASEQSETRHEILVELLGNDAREEGPIQWETCFDALADRLIREFVSRIHGFAQSSRGFIVRNFIALPGRVAVAENRLSIVLTSSPLNAVVHLCRLDDPVEEVPWLGRRRIEFEPYTG